jgi:hypothetical protein
MKQDLGNVCSSPLDNAMATCSSALPVVDPWEMLKSSAFGAGRRERCEGGRGYLLGHNTKIRRKKGGFYYPT